MTRRLLLGVVFAGLAAGCGGPPKPNTAPMTKEEIQKVREEDSRIESDERSGSGSATSVRKKR
jgi:hypothetical protein